MKVMVTGAEGFIGENFCLHLEQRHDVELLRFTKKNTIHDLNEMVHNTDIVFHLAGVNRTNVLEDFKRGNVDTTLALCEAISTRRHPVPIVYTSSTQALLKNDYGVSKYEAEKLLEDFSQRHNFPLFIYRLPNVFGKWAKPNYNSVVATFCYNITRDLPIQIHDSSIEMDLVYIDDLVANFLNIIDRNIPNKGIFCAVSPIYKLSVGELATQIQAFHKSRDTLTTESVGTGLIRALYSTYVSYLPPALFSYELPKHVDPRGEFVEVLKTKEAGQFSFFTAYVGVTRGGHYHHSKTEKFLVIKGTALFRFRHMISDEYYELCTTGVKPEIVETVPGWTHDITNIGQDEMIVMLWANEIFDKNQADTYVCGI